MTDPIVTVIAADRARLAGELRAMATYNTPNSAHRLSVYIAAIEAVTALHTIEKRYHDGSSEWSCDTPEEAAEMGDCELSAVDFFEICTHCGDLEECDDTADWCYMDAIWPCPTIRALAVLAPSTPNKEQQ